MSSWTPNTGLTLLLCDRRCRVIRLSVVSFGCWLRHIRLLATSSAAAATPLPSLHQELTALCTVCHGR